jgi:predicted metal-dependent HD superfamily phosphohydrolase
MSGELRVSLLAHTAVSYTALPFVRRTEYSWLAEADARYGGTNTLILNVRCAPCVNSHAVMQPM